MIYLVPEKLKRRKGKQITDLDFFFLVPFEPPVQGRALKSSDGLSM